VELMDEEQETVEAQRVALETRWQQLGAQNQRRLHVNRVRIIAVALLLVAFGAGWTTHRIIHDGDTTAQQNTLAYYFANTIQPEVEHSLSPIANECTSPSATPDACVAFGLFVAELDGIELARYREAMLRFNVSAPGPEIDPILQRINNDCTYVSTILAATGIQEAQFNGRCTYFESEQLQYHPSPTPTAPP
jgi:hypothetical protein